MYFSLYEKCFRIPNKLLEIENSSVEALDILSNRKNNQELIYIFDKLYCYLFLIN